MIGAGMSAVVGCQRGWYDSRVDSSGLEELECFCRVDMKVKGAEEALGKSFGSIGIYSLPMKWECESNYIRASTNPVHHWGC